MKLHLKHTIIILKSSLSFSLCFPQGFASNSSDTKAFLRIIKNDLFNPH